MYYEYPVVSIDVLTNIVRSLASCPAFYNQVGKSKHSFVFFGQDSWMHLRNSLELCKTLKFKDML